MPIAATPRTNMKSALGELQNRKLPETLLHLLAMNLCAREDSRPFNIGMDPDTGNMSLWTKDYLAFLDANKLACLIRELVDKAALIQRHLQEAGRAASWATPAAKHLPGSRTKTLASSMAASTQKQN